MGRPGSICMVYRLWEQRASNNRTCRIWDRLRVYPSNPASDPLPDKVHSIHTPRLSLYLRRSASCLSKRSRCYSEGSTQGRVNESMWGWMCLHRGENRVISSIQHSQIIFISSLWINTSLKSYRKMELLYSSLLQRFCLCSLGECLISWIRYSIYFLIWSIHSMNSSKRSLKRYHLHSYLRLRHLIVGMILMTGNLRRFMLMWRRLRRGNKTPQRGVCCLDTYIPIRIKTDMPARRKISSGLTRNP